MKKKAGYIICLLCTAILLYSFTGEGDYFKITAADVVFTVPERFPKPNYDFHSNPVTPAGFTLGRRLFYDPILSSDSSVSCGSCHQRIAAFGHIDHRLSHGINGIIGKRNVSALQNLAWKDSYMWDGGVNHLEVQPLNPITNPGEMNESLAHVLEKLRKNDAYVSMFQQAFGDTIINSERLLKSLAQFTGMMVSANARYDKYMQGKDSFTASELRGLQLFRAQCASCHREPLFTDNSYRNNGLEADTALNDLGRGDITKDKADDYKFKVPSLRNVELTYPYMHDGRYRKLSDVLDHYSSSHTLKSSDAAMQKIGMLTDAGKEDIISFLKTLTDKEFIYDRRFADPNMVF